MRLANPIRIPGRPVNFSVLDPSLQYNGSATVLVISVVGTLQLGFFEGPTHDLGTYTLSLIFWVNRAIPRQRADYHSSLEWVTAPSGAH